METLSKCPICGGDVEKGFLSTRGRLWWGSKEMTGATRRGEEVVAGSFWDGTSAPVYRCPLCSMVYLPYEKKTSQVSPKKTPTMRLRRF